MVLPALIGAGAALVGGILGKPKTQSADKNSYDGIMGQARGAREASDRYGFNPLTLLGASSAIGPSTSGNYMGNAIADAGMIVADGLAKRSEQLGQITKLSEENALLKKEIQNATLRPKIAGVYAQRQMTPSLAGALGRSGNNDPMVQTAAAVDQGSAGDSNIGHAGLRPLAESLPIDPRRAVEQKELEPHAGFMTIDNPYLPFEMYFPTLDGDEAMGLNEAAFAIPYGALQAAYRYGAHVKDKQSAKGDKRRGDGPVFSIDGKYYQQRKRKRSKKEIYQQRGYGPSASNPVFVR